MIGLGLILLRYSLRVIAIARAYRGMPETGDERIAVRRAASRRAAPTRRGGAH